MCGAHRAGALLTALTGHFRGFPRTVSLRALSEPHLHLSRHSTAARASSLERTERCTQRSPRNRSTRSMRVPRVRCRRSMRVPRVRCRRSMRVPRVRCRRSQPRRSARLPGASSPPPPPNLHPAAEEASIANRVRGAWSSCWQPYRRAHWTGSTSAMHSADP